MDKYRIYMDVCCLNRPFDGATHERIVLESDAVLGILSYCENGIWNLVSSDVIDFELSNLKNPEKKKKVLNIYSVAKGHLNINDEIRKNAGMIEKSGVKYIDSLHLSTVELNEVDIFLSTDDNLIKAAKRLGLKTRVENPVIWFMEVSNDER